LQALNVLPFCQPGRDIFIPRLGEQNPLATEVAIALSVRVCALFADERSAIILRPIRLSRMRRQIIAELDGGANAP
jgi:hypothetical protein